MLLERLRRSWKMPYKDLVLRKEFHRTYYLNHAGKNKKRRAKGSQLSEEQIAEYKRKWYHKNKEKLSVYKVKWMQNWRTKEDNRLKENKRQVDRKRRLNCCEICNSREKLQFHHYNYENRLGNTLCKGCHDVQHKKVVGRL
jgi:hypothetical protein